MILEIREQVNLEKFAHQVLASNSPELVSALVWTLVRCMPDSYQDIFLKKLDRALNQSLVRVDRLITVAHSDLNAR